MAIKPIHIGKEANMELWNRVYGEKKVKPVAPKQTQLNFFQRFRVKYTNVIYVRLFDFDRETNIRTATPFEGAYKCDRFLFGTRVPLLLLPDGVVVSSSGTLGIVVYWEKVT